MGSIPVGVTSKNLIQIWIRFFSKNLRCTISFWEKGTMTTKNKTLLGQFFTKDELWLKPQIVDFIKSTGCHTAFDPFAGGGHLLEVAKKLGFEKTIGLDIDDNLGWSVNDSLISIPHINDGTIIITNPPYLSNYSASRKGIFHQVKKYFDTTS